MSNEQLIIFDMNLDTKTTEASLRIRNLMRLFLNSIRDYEGECGEPICKDERESLEFVDLFIESEDGFDFNEILKLVGVTPKAPATTDKQLPPELVEKMKTENEYSRNLSQENKARHLAQIAVDYAEKENVELMRSNETDCFFLEEWIRALEAKNWHEDIVQEMKDMLSAKQLLKKREDGK